tara:strand:+ start:283 stop:489 length:207 start_codon:yes stop_codon:yes gene_type:complete
MLKKSRKNVHKDYLWDSIWELRKDIANYVLICKAKNRHIETEKLDHKAELIIKYSAKLKKFQETPTLR